MFPSPKPTTMVDPFTHDLRLARKLKAVLDEIEQTAFTNALTSRAGKIQPEVDDLVTQLDYLTHLA